jgi:hypothetical protein
MKITKEFLKRQSADYDLKVWLKENKLIGAPSNKVLNKLIEANKLNGANWLITHVMNRKQCTAYAIFAAEQVLGIFEKKYPNNKRPRKAIEAAKLVLKRNNKKNRIVAEEACGAALNTAIATCADIGVYTIEAYAAYAAVKAVNTAHTAHTFHTTGLYSFAGWAYQTAQCASSAGKINIELKILKYGVSII